MITKSIIFTLIFILGELLANNTLFPYLKKYFDSGEDSESSNNSSEETKGNSEKFLCFNLSTFKGLLERITLYFALVIGLSQILIVFGAIKIGTRLEKDIKIKNDYFLIGNFSSILISVFYYFIYSTIINYVSQ